MEILPLHNNDDQSTIPLSLNFHGAFVIKNFITEQEEKELAEHFSKCEWKNSQSGRMKLDYGLTKVNFKKKKVKY